MHTDSRPATSTTSRRTQVLASTRSDTAATLCAADAASRCDNQAATRPAFESIPPQRSGGDSIAEDFAAGALIIGFLLLGVTDVWQQVAEWIASGIRSVP